MRSLRSRRHGSKQRGNHRMMSHSYRSKTKDMKMVTLTKTIVDRQVEMAVSCCQLSLH